MTDHERLLDQLEQATGKVYCATCQWFGGGATNLCWHPAAAYTQETPERQYIFQQDIRTRNHRNDCPDFDAGILTPRERAHRKRQLLAWGLPREVVDGNPLLHAAALQYAAQTLYRRWGYVLLGLGIGCGAQWLGWL
jgi:hypothetical protein